MTPDDIIEFVRKTAKQLDSIVDEYPYLIEEVDQLTSDYLRLVRAILEFTNEKEDDDMEYDLDAREVPTVSSSSLTCPVCGGRLVQTELGDGLAVPNQEILEKYHSEKLQKMIVRKIKKSCDTCKYTSVESEPIEFSK